jgi:energy-converting hydrogenase Eha subunit E
MNPTGVVLPGWITAPIGVVLVLLVVVHLFWLAPHVTPPSRRRIRTACGVVMLLTIPLVVIGFSVIVPARQPSLWAMTWIAASSLTAFALGLAVLDMANTLRLHRKQRRRLRDELRLLRAEWRTVDSTSTVRERPSCDAAEDEAP